MKSKVRVELKCSRCNGTRVRFVRSCDVRTILGKKSLCIKCGHKKRLETTGGHAPNWKGGRYLGSSGRMMVWDEVESRYFIRSRKVWEEAHGPIPAGYVVHHKDGDKRNDVLDNLKCLPKKEHDKLHGDHLRRFHWNRRLERVVPLRGTK